MTKKIGIIGGSGLENLALIENPVEHTPYTPYGDPSGTLLSGEVNGVEVVLLSRHGKDHTIPPSKINNRANIWAFKGLGCTHLLSTTACGSLREDIQRGDLVFPDQFIDFTRHREVTFYETFPAGKMKHEQMADPFDARINALLIEGAKSAGIRYHEKGTIITVEGPRFSTRAESKMFRMWGADLINMSVAPEVILSREAGIPYATIAMSTDYDCWKEDEQPVSWEEVIRVFNANVEKVSSLILSVIQKI